MWISNSKWDCISQKIKKQSVDSIRWFKLFERYRILFIYSSTASKPFWKEVCTLWWPPMECVLPLTTITNHLVSLSGTKTGCYSRLERLFVAKTLNWVRGRTTSVQALGATHVCTKAPSFQSFLSDLSLEQSGLLTKDTAKNCSMPTQSKDKHIWCKLIWILSCV